MDKIIEELTAYAELDGTELGETFIALINLWNTRTYLSEKLVKALEKEIKANLADVKENAEIIETEETFTRKVSYLEWK